MNETRLVLIVLAVYRLSRLIAIDDGPLDIFKRTRATIGRSAYRGGIYKSTADWVNCSYCVGIWFAAIAAFMAGRLWRDRALLWLGIAGGQAVLQSIGERDDD